MTLQGQSTRQLLVAALLVLLPLIGSSHDAVSSGAGGVPLSANRLPDPEDGFIPLDVSFDGRYVLFTNVLLPNPVVRNSLPDSSCTIYRKDRDTGQLMTVFESVPGARFYCYGAKMSTDGEIVVASPASVPSNPEGETVVEEINGIPTTRFDFGDVIALTVRNIGAGTEIDITERFVTANSGELARAQLGTGMGQEIRLFPGYGELMLAGNATFAIGTRFVLQGSSGGQIFQRAFKSFDLTTGAVESDDLLENIDFQLPAVAQITGASVNGSGRFVAVSANVSAVSGNVWPITDPCVVNSPNPSLSNCRSTNFFVLDRQTETIVELAELRRTRGLSSGFVVSSALPGVRPDSLSLGGNVVTLVDLPLLCRETGNFSQLFPCNESGSECVGDECSLTITRINITTRELEVQTTQVGNLTEHLYFATARLSRNSRFLLYPRAPINPLGGDFRFRGELNQLPPTSFICISRESIDNGSGIPVAEPCIPTDPGPISSCGFLDPFSCGTGPFPFVVFTRQDSPVLWYLRDLDTGSEQLVSVHSGNYFQSTDARLSDDGGTIAFATRDPRLREDMLTNNSLDESLLPDECFWPNGPDEPNLRVVTNDNVEFFTAPTQYVYEAMPIFCPAPSPVIEGQIYADDLFSRGITLAPVERASSSFAWLLLPLVSIALWRRRRLH